MPSGEQREAHHYDADLFIYDCTTHFVHCAYKFTGKERDAESGLDYFGARYYGSNMGRFMSPDPLMASAHVSDPQSWNRYSYAHNNPLSNIDPDGMEDCRADASKCSATIKVNVIYDKNANGGKGLTDSQKADFQKNILGKAVGDFGKSGIGVQVSYTAGSVNAQDSGGFTVSGVQKGALNLAVSDSLPTGKAGESGLSSNGTYVSAIGLNDAHGGNYFPLFTNTIEHEFTHQLKGDTQNPNTNPAAYIMNEFNVDFRVQMMGWGVQQNTLVNGAQNKPFTVQTQQKAIQPRTDK